MRVAWVPLLLGLGLTAGGLLLASVGWQGMAQGAPDPASVSALGAGILVILLGVLMVVVPLLVPVLYRLYGEAAFRTRGGACPVVSRCQRCGEFNFRGRADCKQCGMDLVWELPKPGQG